MKPLTVMMLAPLLCSPAALVLTGAANDAAVPASNAVLFVQDQAPATPQPSAWIGVRLTPVPGPLAAHIGKDGLLVVNVVVDSPADAAGLQRYDVIRGFDGRAVTNMDDLRTAISDVGAGNRTTLTVLREGAEQSLEISPTTPPNRAQQSYKYDEPRVTLRDDDVNYFGQRITRDRDGNLIIQPFGRLQRLPDHLQKLLDPSAPAWRELEESLRHLQRDPFGMTLDLDESGAFNFQSLPGENVEMEFRFKVADDDGSIEIHRRTDGTIRVTRVDAQGDEQVTEYDSAEQLEKNDPEAFELYQSRKPGGAVLRLPPTLRNLPELQKDFQMRIERQLDDTSIESLRRHVEELRQGLMDEARRLGVDADRETTRRGLSVEIGDQGNVDITVTGDEGPEVFHYDSVEQFRTQNPELYRKVEPLLETGDLRGAAPALHAMT